MAKIYVTDFKTRCRWMWLMDHHGPFLWWGMGLVLPLSQTHPWYQPSTWAHTSARGHANVPSHSPTVDADTSPWSGALRVSPFSINQRDQVHCIQSTLRTWNIRWADLNVLYWITFKFRMFFKCFQLCEISFIQYISNFKIVDHPRTKSR